MASQFSVFFFSVTEVLTNRDLLQRIVRLGVGSGTQTDAAVPFKPGQNSDWSSFLLVNSFWKACLQSYFRPAHGRSPPSHALCFSGVQDSSPHTQLLYLHHAIDAALGARAR